MQVWDWEQNAAEGLDPHRLTCDSQKKAYFKFPLHQWSAEIMYVAKAKESGYPYCSGRQSSKSA